MKKLMFLILLITFNLIVNFNGFANNLEDKTKKLEKYLSSINNISFIFQQSSNDKKVLEGWMQIKKPDKIRIEYNEPNNTIIIANKNYIVLYNAKDNLRTSLENDGPWIIFTKNNPILSNNQNDINITGYVEEVKEIDMNNKKHLFYKIFIKNKNNLQLSPIIIHTTLDPFTILGWTISDNKEKKTYIKIKTIISINKNNIKDDVFSLSKREQDSGDVWKGPFNRPPAKRRAKHR